MESDVLIIGAGPAGMTAALQLTRSGLSPLLVERDRIGGALLNAGRVENYPAFPEGISGVELVRRFAKHLRAFGVEVHQAEVERISLDGDRVIAGAAGREISARAAVVASGSMPVQLDVPGAAELRNRLLFYELKDLPEEPGRVACVIGGGDVAYDYALSLAGRGISVKLVMRSDQPGSLALLSERVDRMPLIETVYGVEILRISETDGADQAVGIQFSKESHEPIGCDFVMAAVGRRPNTDLLTPGMLKSERATPPILLAGDVVNGSYRQVGIAVGDGLRCAMRITEILKTKA